MIYNKTNKETNKQYCHSVALLFFEKVDFEAKDTKWNSKKSNKRRKMQTNILYILHVDFKMFNQIYIAIYKRILCHNQVRFILAIYRKDYISQPSEIYPRNARLI